MSKEAQFDERGDKPRRVRLAFALLFSTQAAVSEVETWLDDYCEGQWNLTVEGMDDELIKKSLKITFELEADKRRFIDDYARA